MMKIRSIRLTFDLPRFYQPATFFTSRRQNHLVTHQKTEELSPTFELTHLIKDIKHSIRTPSTNLVSFIQTDLLDATLHELSHPRSSSRIAIWGDRTSRAFELIESLVYNPLSSDPKPTELLYSRSTNDLLEIRYGQTPKLDQRNGLLELPNPWLDRHRIQLLELTRPLEQQLTKLPPCDVQLLILDNIRNLNTFDNLIRTLAYSPNFIIVINSISLNDDSSQQTDFEKNLNAIISPRAISLNRPHVIKLNSSMAINSLRTLSNQPTQLQHIDGEKLLKSGIYSLTDYIINLLKCPNLHLRTTISITRHTLGAISQAIIRLHEQIHERQLIIHEFEINIKELKKQAKRVLEIKFNNKENQQNLLQFWNLIGTNDSIKFDINQKHLHQLLSFQAGQLNVINSQINSITETFLEVNHKWINQITINEVKQNLNQEINQEELQKPIYDRTKQMIEGPLNLLKSKLQTSILSFSLTNLGILIIISFNSFQQIILNHFLIGTFLEIIGIWKLQNNWEKSKQKFHQDMKRCNDNLESDLQTQANEIIEERLMKGSKLLINQVNQIINNDQLKTKALIQELEGYRKRLEEIESRLN
ncbi:hypothetical protein CROQUDRAFT_655378 [Cronartium quercuum f. sp. fusiforme G11]|uniref:Uncharacterized protein n=1 Tax=Cronartium quercuum f. sp. fusiforme G11 TaxID=708437 RepID=A0A9P6NL77_9BASI|nr:hypothetical protein CROQUDRAFT_655378 [Cronartium quercuum f. sp. fusiforme G11]